MEKAYRAAAKGGLILACVAMPFSIRWCHLGVLVFLLAWVFEGQWKAKVQRLKDNPIALLLPFFYLLHVVGMIYTDNISNGWLQLDKKAALFLLPITFASTRLISTEDVRKLLQYFLFALLAATVICLAFAAYNFTHSGTLVNFSYDATSQYQQLNPGSSLAWMYFSYVGLASGISLHPTFFGLYLIFCLLIIVELKSRSDQPLAWWWYALFFYIGVFILLLSSRIILIGGTIAILYGLFKMTQPSNPKRYAAMAIVLFFVVAIFYFNPVSRYRILQEPTTSELSIPVPLAKTSIEIRASLWWLATKAIQQTNLWIGAGTGDVADIMKQLMETNESRNILNTYDPHNQYLQTLLALGIPGLLSLLACLSVPIVQSIKRGMAPLTIIFVVFGVVCLTESALEVQKGIIFFAFFGSLLLLKRPEGSVYEAGATS